MLSTYNTGLAFVFMGKKAKGWHKSVASNNYKFFTTHPASAAYSWKQKWDSGNMFANVNKVLYNNNGEQITW